MFKDIDGMELRIFVDIGPLKSSPKTLHAKLLTHLSQKRGQVNEHK